MVSAPPPQGSRFQLRNRHPAERHSHCLLTQVPGFHASSEGSLAVSGGGRVGEGRLRDSPPAPPGSLLCFMRFVYGFDGRGVHGGSCSRGTAPGDSQARSLWCLFGEGVPDKGNLRRGLSGGCGAEPRYIGIQPLVAGAKFRRSDIAPGHRGSLAGRSTSCQEVAVVMVMGYRWLQGEEAF